ncbi:MAG: hypothetical protein E6Q98_00135 [Rhodospirillaceae bacterium]|nr:MAG: hypothetical protein E6Q98_00135 [Rhodospirillaceae bacterium]
MDLAAAWPADPVLRHRSCRHAAALLPGAAIHSAGDRLDHRLPGAAGAGGAHLAAPAAFPLDRHRRHRLVLLTPDIGTDLDPRGLGFAALTGLAWACFVPVSKQAGRLFPGIRSLALGMWTATVLLLPFALAEGSLLQAGLPDLGGAFAVALLSTVLPCVMEFQALQRLSARSYGILMTLEPALGALVGAIFLSQDLGMRMLIAIICVTVAAMGMTLSERQDDR